jgi:methylthioribose-1-phosphate isomerase
MRNLESTGLRVKDNSLTILDQQLLPHQESWICVQNPDEMVSIIKDLKVRGAPMIGISASISLALFAAKGGAGRGEVEEAYQKLLASRPTAVNLEICLNRLIQSYRSGSIEEMIHTAEAIFFEDVALCERISENGAALLDSKESILTICNTGSIATAGKGTALGIIYKAYERGIDLHVYVDETRPLLQGGRLTTWELLKHQIPCTLICDNAAASLMRQGKVSRVLAGADRIAKNGDTANKIGTYSLAVLAHHHNIPFYIAAPATTLDLDCNSGNDMVIEERAASEVRGVQGSFGQVQWSPSEVPVYNPAFDVTPIELITGIILDSGYYSREALKGGVLENSQTG